MLECAENAMVAHLERTRHGKRLAEHHTSIAEKLNEHGEDKNRDVFGRGVGFHFLQHLQALHDW